ncbi:Cof-type HAD-IIB family hydrolase [Christiangramia flava]|uniref:Hydrolase (HAD superfamily) n=1 Tax=Christiangramia flava JLT2011 TaxID=1229726 RepID=A0A1L7I6G1_9FLAO|nr:Cof-type HAD-IIB family hydrolase [Christiangramia flava]APU69187.1 Hydrolase (HAD superfamily) [Christiangramia flava JLT2011]OSS38913.1 haloacid dehalogenase-like hydrolase [Christiangramia flava JLT2011]
MFKIIFSDIDGTLLNENRDVSTYTIETVKKLQGKIPFILISSRMPAAMRHLQKKLGIEELPLISYNGGLILVDGKPISSTEIEMQILQELHDFNLDHDVHLSLYHQDEWYAPSEDFWTRREIHNTKVSPEILKNEYVISKWNEESKGAHKIMAMGEEEKIDSISSFLKDHHGDSLHLYRSKPTYLEIAPRQISKLTAVEHLLKSHYSIPLSQSMAFGDNYNDIEMLKGVGMGIAVGNAKPDVLEVAHMVTAPGKEDGVAKSINKLLQL